MKNATFFPLLFCLLRIFTADAQTAFLKKLVTASSKSGNYQVTDIKIRPTPDGNWLMGANTLGEMLLIKLNPAYEVLSTHKVTLSPGHDHKLSDAWQLGNGDYLCLLDLDENPNPIISSQLYLRRYTADFQEIWSLHIKTFAGQGRAVILPSKDNFFYVYVPDTGPGSLLKVTDDGQVVWSKMMNKHIVQNMLELPNGNLAAALKNFDFKSDFVLFDPDGKVLKVLDLPLQESFSYSEHCRLNIFPGGDILLSYQSPDYYAVVFQRFSADMELKEAWEIYTGQGKIINPAVVAVNDSLLYWSCSTEGNTILATMDGYGNVQKSVLFPGFFNWELNANPGYKAGPEEWGAIRYLPDTSTVALLKLDTALTLPNCALVPYHCLKRQSVEITNNAATVDIKPVALQNYYDSVSWEAGQAHTGDYCLPYQAPEPKFHLPDTLCQGSIVHADSLDGNIQEHVWIIGRDSILSDTFINVSPYFAFDEPGQWSVTHQILYLGCNVDSFSRLVTVLPAPLISLGDDQVLCNAEMFTPEVGLSGAISWAWENLDTSLHRVFTQSGVYVLEANNQYCTSKDTLEVLFQSVDADFSVVERICTGDTFSPVPATDTDGVAHQWFWDNSSKPVAESIFPNLKIETTGTFYLQHIAHDGDCRDTVGRWVEATARPSVLLPATAALCRDSSLLLSPDTLNVTNFQWEDNSPSLNRWIEEGGTYRIAVSNGQCEDTATIQVIVRPCKDPGIYIPNVFAPESQGENRVFQVFHDNIIEQIMLLEVFDRWGSLVFRSTEGKGWDGTTGQRPAPPGSYAYLLKVKLTDGAEAVYAGGVTLIR